MVGFTPIITGTHTTLIIAEQVFITGITITILFILHIIAGDTRLITAIILLIITDITIIIITMDTRIITTMFIPTIIVMMQTPTVTVLEAHYRQEEIPIDQLKVL